MARIQQDYNSKTTFEMTTWLGEIPTHCQICNAPITDTFIDGKLSANRGWCLMCPKCHVTCGCGLGVGKGQKYTSVK